MIRFSEYMKEWLYGENGYYSSMPKIGKKGDFATSVTTSMFFGGTIAKRALKLINDSFLSKNAFIVEVGAHHGYLLADMVQFIHTLNPELLQTLRFAVIEPLDKLQKAQQKYFFESFGNVVKFEWFGSLKEFKCKEAFVITNELFDAFPCEVVKDGKMLYIDRHKAVFGDMDEGIRHLCKKYKITRGEIALGYEDWAKELFASVKKCEFITFDYGQKDVRGDISLRIYKEHKTYPFFSLTDFAKDEKLKNLSLEKLYKSSDLTYDVNFSHLEDVFVKNGFKKEKFCTQASALVEFGLTELLEILQKKVDEKSYRAEFHKAVQLIDPSFLGERFSMISFRKG